MGESTVHSNLVRHMFHWVSQELLYGDTGHIFVDLPEASKTSKPPLLRGGYRPDLYVLRGQMLIIGEAKTSGDLEREHSLLQLRTYIEILEQHQGKAYLVMAVPWYLERRTKSILKMLQKGLDSIPKTEIKVIPKLLG